MRSDEELSAGDPLDEVAFMISTLPYLRCCVQVYKVTLYAPVYSLRPLPQGTHPVGEERDGCGVGDPAMQSTPSNWRSHKVTDVHTHMELLWSLLTRRSPGPPMCRAASSIASSSMLRRVLLCRRLPPSPLRSVEPSSEL